MVKKEVDPTDVEKVNAGKSSSKEIDVGEINVKQSSGGPKK